MVTSVEEDNAIVSRATEVAQRLAAGPIFALGQYKRMLGVSWSLSREPVGEEETRVIAEAVMTSDATALIRAFGHR